MALGISKRPAWLNKRIDFNKCQDLNRLFDGLSLNTVCREAFCPNISECFSRGTATFLILGKRCTRGCSFCAVQSGDPDRPDPDEPDRVAEAVRKLGLRHVVITSVTRDDLADGGASVFSRTIRAIRDIGSGVAIEVLVPDFNGDREAIRGVLSSGPDIFGHNVETVPRLYGEVRNGADYERSLEVLRAAKEIAPDTKTKSGIMLGLGERRDEVLDVMRDLRRVDCDFLSIGQYLSPSPEHTPVKEYIPPEEFQHYRDAALDLGFTHVESTPYTRSSYLAGRYTHPF